MPDNGWLLWVSVKPVTRGMSWLNISTASEVASRVVPETGTEYPGTQPSSMVAPDVGWPYVAELRLPLGASVSRLPGVPDRAGAVAPRTSQRFPASSPEADQVHWGSGTDPMTIVPLNRRSTCFQPSNISGRASN